MIKKAKMLVLACGLLLAACGGGGGGGIDSLAEFNTVYLRLSNGTGSLDSDLAVWEDEEALDRCTAQVPALAPDSMSVNYVLSAYPNHPAQTPSSVLVEWYRIDYRPATPDSPPLDSYEEAISFELPTGSGSFDVLVAPIGEVKEQLNANVCTDNPLYKYYVTITLRTREVNTGKIENPKISGTIRFRDFVDND